MLKKLPFWLFPFLVIPVLGSSQTLDWAFNVGGTSNEYGRAVATDDSGNVYITGFFEGTVNFDPSGVMNLTSAGGMDVFIQKINYAGNLVWAKRIGGTGNENGVVPVFIEEMSRELSPKGPDTSPTGMI